MRILLSIGGASGSIYGIRLFEELIKSGVEVHLVVSNGAKKILEHETGHNYEDLKKKAGFCYDNDDLFAPPASGSFQLDAMVIVPCSMKTLSAIANGYGDTFTSRVASCCLKEGRKLVLVIRETPLDLPGIKNMLAAKQSGAVILPAMPGFYHRPYNIEELVNFIVGKIFDQLGLEHNLFKRWG
ncbi:MAG: UbiX family flavin prenyltransferase [Thermoplasmatales archaeon]|nr:UbiX family flavin prenyltransferase [Thermoplasmatales archaeon]